jgi:hypothetical protein
MKIEWFRKGQQHSCTTLRGMQEFSVTNLSGEHYNEVIPETDQQRAEKAAKQTERAESRFRLVVLTESGRWPCSTVLTVERSERGP